VIAKNPYLAFSVHVAEQLEHSRHSIEGIAPGNERPARLGREYVSLSEAAHIVRGKRNLGDTSEIPQLREARVEILIVHQLFLF